MKYTMNFILEHLIVMTLLLIVLLVIMCVKCIWNYYKNGELGYYLFCEFDDIFMFMYDGYDFDYDYDYISVSFGGTIIR